MDYDHACGLPTWVADLTTRHVMRAPYSHRSGATTYTMNHLTNVPSLLDQLRSADLPTCAPDEPSSSSAYGSRPAGNIEALDTLMLIDNESSRWVRILGEDDPSSTEGCITLLHGLHAGLKQCKKSRLNCCDNHQIERDIRRWWLSARIITGWDSAAWRPNNTCPICDQRGMLRIRLSASSAMCIGCREVWDSSTIGCLAEHIRGENADEETQVAEVIGLPIRNMGI